MVVTVSPAAIESRRGLEPFETDQDSVPDELSIDSEVSLEHFEFIPSSGEFIPQKQYQELLNKVQFVET